MAVGFPTTVPHCLFPFPCIPNVCMHFRVSYYNMLSLSGTLSCGVLNSKTNTEVDPVSGDCLVPWLTHGCPMFVSFMKETGRQLPCLFL